MTCVICDNRPARKGDYCCQCAGKLEKQRKAQNGNGRKVHLYLHWKGNVIALVETGKNTHRYIPEYYGTNLNGIPKSRLIDLDGWCEGYTRQQIGKFKACFSMLVHA